MDATVTVGNITLPLKRSARARVPYYLMGRPPPPPFPRLTLCHEFSHLVPIMPSVQAAAGAAYRGETLLNKRGCKCRIIHHLLPTDSGETGGGDTVAASGQCAVAALHLMQPIKVIPPTGAELGNRIISLKAHLCPSVWTLRRFYGCFLHISLKLTDTEQMQLHRRRP